jgi:hypothetical protein
MNKAFFSKTNIILLSIGFALLVLGFWFLATPPVDGFVSLTAAPLILVLTYLVIIPLGIIWGTNDKTEN